MLLASALLFVASSWVPAPTPARSAGGGDGAPVIPILFPLQERVSWEDTWGAARSGHTHEGNDLLVPKMTPLLAVVDGTLDWLNVTSSLSSYNGLPYYNILLRGNDGNDYFYIHLNNDTPGTDDGRGGVANAYAPGMTNGTHVKQGQIIGYSGDSGNAEDTAPHLHFEIHLGGYKNPIDPYNSLKAAPTYDEWMAKGGGPIGTSTTTTEPDPGPGGQIDPEAPPFADVTVTDWFYGDLTTVYDAGVVNGSGGVFRPYGSVTRAQFAAFLVRGLAPQSLTTPAPETPVFVDVPASFWGYREIAAAAAAGLVRGVGDGTRFAPNAPITRAQMATMLCRALESGGADRSSAAVNANPDARPFQDVPADYWATADIVTAQSLGLIAGGADGCFRPEDTTNRAQAVTVIARALRLVGEGSGS